MVNRKKSMALKDEELGIAPFLLKCYEMVDDPATDSLISWSLGNDSFIVWNPSLFTSQLLPKYFNHNTFSSFQRQLNIYGFRKHDTDRWEFANNGFIKNQKHLLMSINRKKQLQVTTQQKVTKPKTTNISPVEGNKYAYLWKEVESLKTDKNMLTRELVKQRQHQKASQNKMSVLRDQFKDMEQNQQQMLSFIVVVMRNPGFLANPVQSVENKWSESSVREESEGAMVKYQPPFVEPDSNCEELLEMDLSFDEVKDLIESMDLVSELPLNENVVLTSENYDPLITYDQTYDQSDSDHMIRSTAF
ncbi:heat stress transcription factor A-8-like [Rutidosis leptorrhynchoides]|uniref:heat stress transcription factor A-8-like n=1 Tax=Rutidosis leptorrhynchoides TaxID=125765 RepID=UPI003A9A00FD